MIKDEFINDVDEYLDLRESAKNQGISPPVKLYSDRSLTFEEFTYLVIRQLIREQKVLLVLSSSALGFTLFIKIANRFL